ncbi:MAG: DUF3460 family protein [Hydrogenophaga sp.]|uniref:DUF3460 family protein n=1 Tax=Hydrogenophaga sp. TaxID=1904254 RepID=UPI0016A782A5|nr:DUF3460 family protein [Hydrogenophaga sp.]NIM43105.1 DUF3460 family protein [Hydrogenophaga sp.]NIN28173.1 DUF3460 family protein [Hydrogenophaga sp.]NIN30611.1 DUF3460 family protein [Hydrogenophaga sp.]NIN57308.1 DUF3460 family protein [Hydrogenophaga sp.]NIO51527.1 DUF3460 family protein [Hydrogenophaga sp.]
MSFFRRPDYRSEVTQFIDQLKAARPELEAKQREGRGLLWDKTIDREFSAAAEAAEVPQKPYVYQTNSDFQ